MTSNEKQGEPQDSAHPMQSLLDSDTGMQMPQRGEIREGVIARITLEGVIVQQAQRSKHGFVDKTDLLLKVGAKAEEQKRSMVSASMREMGKGK